MRALRTACIALLLAAVIAVAQSRAATDNANPAALAFIQDLGNDALKGLISPAIAPSEREARFRRLLNDHFDIVTISRFVLGRYWRSANAAQRVEFQQLYVDFIVGSYSMRFSDYLGEGVKVTGSDLEDDGTVLVHSKIDMPSADDIRVDWRLRRTGGSFAIVDIVIEGASMGVTQRSEFASVIQNQGVDGLIDALRTKKLRPANSSTQQ
jgi:phospholipid transport system substrate-binding protein